MSKTPEEKASEQTSLDVCPRCGSTSSTIVRKEPVLRGYRITRKCDRCGNLWTYKTEYGPGAWRY